MTRLKRAAHVLALTAALLLCAGGAASKGAALRRTVRLSAAFSPMRLGRGTTVHVGFSIRTPPGLAPLAPTELRLSLPAGLAVATSDLGLDTCMLARLEREGATACPPNSIIGHGSALAEVPFGSLFVLEQARMSLFSGPVQDGHPQLLFLASGESPVLADLAFTGAILPGDGRFSGVVDTKLPLVPGVPRGPDVALVGFHTTIGPQGLTYYETVEGRRVAFHPRGIRLPRSCPPEGFTFAVALSFQDASTASASTAVPCPKPSARRSRPQPATRRRR